MPIAFNENDKSKVKIAPIKQVIKTDSSAYVSSGSAGVETLTIELDSNLGDLTGDKIIWNIIAEPDNNTAFVVIRDIRAHYDSEHSKTDLEIIVYKNITSGFDVNLKIAAFEIY